MAILLGAGLMWADHLAWRDDHAGNRMRVLTTPAGRWLATTDRYHLDLELLDGEDRPLPPADLYVMPQCEVATRLPRLTTTLCEMGSVLRVQSTLWEAIVAGICHQDAHAPHSAFAELCGLGEAVRLPTGRTYQLVPPPKVLVTTSSSLDWLDSTSTLQKAADAFIANRVSWQTASVMELVAAISAIEGIDEDTAGRIVADCAGDYSVYPIDAEFLGWANAAAGAVGLPIDLTKFRRFWCGLTEGHTSAVTALLVAWAAKQPDFSPR